MKVRRYILAAAVAVPCALAPVAAAHVTLQPPEAPAGGFTRLDVRVTNERDNADTTKVEIQMPPGFLSVSTEPVPGWDAELTMRQLDEPVEQFGERVTEEVGRITFTADGEASAIQPGQFLDFGLSLPVPEGRPGTMLTFKALQTYSNGEVVRWIGPPDSEEPAPQVELTPAEEEEVAAPAAEEPAAPAAAEEDDDSNGLAIAALVVGGLGLASGVAALLLSRRRTRVGAGEIVTLMRRARLLTLALVAALLGSAVLAATALGHAALTESKPRSGQVLERSPRTVLLVFDEAIDPEFVQLRVEDGAGRRVERGEPYHPGGREERLAVRLAPGLEGAYAASYRVISEDGHPVVKRIPFRVRPPTRERDEEEAMTPPAGSGPAGPAMEAGGGEHEALETGAVTDAAFAVTRGLGYLAIALAVGGVVFLFVVWLPALAHVAGSGSGWLAASETFTRTVRRIAEGAVLLGLAATAGAIVLQAATSTGTSFWTALDPDAVDAVSDTRPVRAWGARLGVWLLLGITLLVVLRPRHMPGLRRAALGAVGAVPGPPLSRPQVLLLGGTIGALAFTVAAAGHSWTYSPSGLLVLADMLHVLSVSAWLGGLAMLLFALPIAVRALHRRERLSLMAAAVGRFSRLAVVAVALLLLSGIVQSIALIGAFDALVETAYGRLVLAKIVLFLGLISFGAYNQRRLLPRLRTVADGGEEPERAAALLRRSVACEVALALVVLGLASVLVATEPAVS